MDTLIELVPVFLTIINTAGIVRGIYCIIRICAEQDEGASYTKKIVNLIIFLIFANCILSFLTLIKAYY